MGPDQQLSTSIFSENEDLIKIVQEAIVSEPLEPKEHQGQNYQTKFRYAKE